jgi:outer membrane protein W
VFPEPGVGGRTRAVAQFHAVTPDDDFSPKVGLGGQEGKVLEGVCIPDPAVIREGVLERVSVRSWGYACEVGLD